MEKNNKENDELVLIPKCEKYIQYMIEVILKIPRTEKFNIGNEYKNSMYRMLTEIMYLNKIEEYKRISTINKIDAELNIQRILIRILYKNSWIDTKKFNYSIELIGEIGKIVGGLLKYYGKNFKK